MMHPDPFLSLSRSWRSLLALVAMCSSAGAFAQGLQYSITGGSATACSGVIEDSGGPSAEYGDNENYTFTICPDIPGNVIYLTWFFFDLSTMGNDDHLSIYDGDNTGETSLGTYTGTELQNLIVSGTVFNTTGCLTLVFQSNGSGVGNFSCGIQCTTPCEHPLAVASMSEPVPLLACVDEPITFDGSASYAAPGFTIQQYLWNFDDGTVDSTSGPVVTHSFDNDGEYVVQLLVTDENDCSNLNLVDLQVLVSTTPNFSLTSESVETCFGETVTLVGNAQPVTWTGMPDAGIGEPALLPDDVGSPYQSGLVYEQFNPGQEMTSTSDLLSICVEMEHSFMGDLVLQVICPNGQTTILHQQGGGGLFIGDANDMDAFDPEPGTCWTYCWSPTATNGTFEENSTTSTVPSSQGTALAPGTYEAVQPLDQLIGCPLNGEWIFQSTDLWAADNGFICNWTINWNPAIIPDVTTFTPSFGLDPDSTFWTGAPGSTITFNGDTATFTADSPGVYNFNYNVLDNFGCPYDTTITVTINDPFTVDAGPDGVICNDPLQLNAMVVGSTQDCEWTLEMNDSGWDGWNGASLTITVDGVPTVYSCAGNFQSISIPITAGDEITLTYAPGAWEWEVSYTLMDDMGNTIFDDGPNPLVGLVWTGQATCGGEGGMTWEWTPTEGLSDPTIPDPTVVVTSETEFTVSAWPTGHPVCAASDQVTITLDPGLDPGNDSLVIVCATPPSFDLITMLGGTPNPGGVWTDENGNVVPDTFNPMVDAAGIYTYTVTTLLGCIGTADLEIQILGAADPQCCGVVDAGPDALVCELEYLLSASVGNTGMGIWTGPAGYVINEPWNAQTEVTAPGSGPAMFYWTEDDGVLCYLIDSVTITFTEPLEAVVTRTDAICFEACDGTASVAVTGGNGAYSYSWTDNLADDEPNAEHICAGTYNVIVTDENGCGTDEDFSIGQPELLEIDAVSIVEPWCHGDCNGSITITDAEAVQYSFDGGVIYQATATKDSLCTGLYDIAIKNANDCIGTGVIAVTEPPQVVAEFDHIPVPANIDAPVITFYNQSEHAVAWIWDMAGLGTFLDENPQFRFSETYPGTYEVCLTAIDNHGCMDTVCHDVVIDDVLQTYAPNTFTPDGDGVNDMWLMVSNIPDIMSFEMRVFDRWGQVVFETTDPLKAWDGKHMKGGDVLKQDVYAFRCTFQIISTGGLREYMGHVSLLK
ncbi:MAG: gliding motility-associated C-terminal domain-containing protein [Flavobacteriales bacterium]|nr:gliding motility-associated C-terminal domain-containing protein [Flavobacteriales bacterium]